MRSKFSGKCGCCGKEFAAGEEIDYIDRQAWLPGHYADRPMTAEELESETARAEALGFTKE